MAHLVLAEVSRKFGSTAEVVALNDVSIELQQGDYVALEGESGSGKSTLVGILGLLDLPSSGSYRIDDHEISQLTPDEQAIVRSDSFSYIFQAFHVLERRPVVDSVELPLLYRGLGAGARRERALTALKRLGIDDLAQTHGRFLSGGQRQRVAIARALASGSPVLLADEPTGNLDSRNTALTMDALDEVHSSGATIVLVTHSDAVASRAKRRITVRDGNVNELVPQEHDELRRSAPTPPGRASTVLRRAMFSDVWRNLISRPSRLAAMMSAVAVSVALVVVTLGFGAVASHQVSQEFDAVSSREVTVTEDVDEELASSDVLRRLGELNGVTGVAQVIATQSFGSSGAARETVGFPWVHVKGDLQAVARLTLASGDQSVIKTLNPGEALVGDALAEKLQIASADASPTVFLAGNPYVVVGVISASPREPELIGSIVTSDVVASGAQITSSKILISSTSGAARQIATEAALVVDPYSPENVQVRFPPDPSTMRAGVEANLNSAMAILTIVALAVSAACIGLAVSSAVSERRAEIGLRRALGARRRHIAIMLVLESGVAGGVASSVGLVVGLLGVLVVTIANRWTPVISIDAALVALVAGAAISVFGAVLGAFRAVRINPNDALRPNS